MCSSLMHQRRVRLLSVTRAERLFHRPTSCWLVMSKQSYLKDGFATETTGHWGQILYLLFVVVTLPSLTFAQAPAATEVLNHDKFGRLVTYSPGPKPKGLALLLAGERGWDPQMVHLAREIAQLDYLVAGVDSIAYLSHASQALPRCDDLVADLTNLARFLEHHYHLPARPPVLVGYAAGAGVVYAALLQAPAATFHAGISLDFCPHLPYPNPRCNGPALTNAPSDDESHTRPSRKRLATTWFVFQSEPACNKDDAIHFVKQIDNAKLTILPQKRENLASGGNQWPQLMALLQWPAPRISGWR